MAVNILVNTLCRCVTNSMVYNQSQPSVNRDYIGLNLISLINLKGRVSLLRDGLSCLASCATQKKIGLYY